MNIRDFLERLSEMDPIVIFVESNTFSGNAGGGYPQNLSICAEYEETIELLFENDNSLNLKKAHIQSIDYQGNCVFVTMDDGTRITFEGDD